MMKAELHHGSAQCPSAVSTATPFRTSTRTLQLKSLVYQIGLLVHELPQCSVLSAVHRLDPSM